MAESRRCVACGCQVRSSSVTTVPEHTNRAGDPCAAGGLAWAALDTYESFVAALRAAGKYEAWSEKCRRWG